MTKDEIFKIKEHIEIHARREPYAIKITEIMWRAVDELEHIAELEKENTGLKLKLEALEGETPWKDIKDKSELIKENTELKARNEKMKCCGNCKHYKPVVTVNESISNMCEDYYDGCNNIYEPYNKWELKEK